MSHFCLAIKRKAILQSISWLQFGGFLLIGLVIYYGYVFLRYYRQEIGRHFGGRQGGALTGVKVAGQSAREHSCCGNGE